MEAETLEVYELSYSQLMLLSSGNVTSSAPEQLDNVDSVISSLMETLGPAGPGLLAITGVPNASKLRKKLLPMARKLALLDPETRKSILKVLANSFILHYQLYFSQILCLFFYEVCIFYMQLKFSRKFSFYF